MRRIPGKDIMSLYLNTHNYSSTYAKATEKDGITRVDTESYNATNVLGTLAVAAVIGFGAKAGSYVFEKAVDAVPKVVNKASKKVSSVVDCLNARNTKHNDPNAKEGIDDEEELDD